MKILYAEDEDVTRINYARYLKRYFNYVYEARDGKEALEIYDKVKPEVLLLDIDMPKMDGLEVAKKIREKDKRSRIIMLTAIKDIDKLILATELNLTKYLPKPISREKLKEALKKAISEVEENRVVYLDKNLFWNIDSKELFYKEKNIKLTKYEKRFFEILLSIKGNTFSNSEVIDFVWEDNDISNGNSRLKDLVKRVRKKLPVNIIENVYSQGYRIIN